MQEHTSNPLEELAREPVSSQELRALLERLGSQELGGPEEPDVRAVSEATGASILDVARILAETRRKDLLENFGRDLDRHEKDILRLDLAVAALSKRNADRMANGQKAESQEVRPTYNQPITGFAFAVVVAIIGVVLGSLPSTKEGADSVLPAITTTLRSGDRVFVDSAGVAWVIEPDGTRRAPRQNEEEVVRNLRQSQSKNRKDH